MQQSRFLALMDGSERYFELRDAAMNSEDAGLLQYSKTLDSLETKLNNIKTSFQQFYMGIFNGPFVGGVLDFINDLIEGLNKLNKITVIFNVASIIKGVKTLGNMLVSLFSATFGKIGQQWKQTMQDVVATAGQSGSQAKEQFQGNATRQNYKSYSNKSWLDGKVVRRYDNDGNYISATKYNTLRKEDLTFKGAHIASMAGGVLSLLGSGVAHSSQVGGAIISGAGNALSSGATISQLLLSLGGSAAALAGPVGLAIGALVGLGSIISSLPTALEQAQEAYEKSSQEFEEKNIARAQAQEKANNLESTIENLKKLQKAQYDSAEAQQDFINAQNDAADQFPELVGAYDILGNATINLVGAEESLAAARQQSITAAVDAAKAELKNKKDALKIAEETQKELTGGVDTRYVDYITSESTGWHSWGRLHRTYGRQEISQDDFFKFLQNAVLTETLGGNTYSDGTLSISEAIFKEMFSDYATPQEAAEAYFTSKQTIANSQASISAASKGLYNQYFNSAYANAIGYAMVGYEQQEWEQLPNISNIISEHLYNNLQSQDPTKWFDEEGNLKADITQEDIAAKAKVLIESYQSAFSNLFSSQFTILETAMKSFTTGDMSTTKYLGELKRSGVSEQSEFYKYQKQTAEQSALDMANNYAWFLRNYSEELGDGFETVLYGVDADGGVATGEFISLSTQAVEDMQADMVRIFESDATTQDIQDAISAREQLAQLFANVDSELAQVFFDTEFSNITSITELEQAIQKATEEERLSQVEADAIVASLPNLIQTLQKVSPLNLITSYGSYVSSTAESLETYKSDFEKALSGMEYDDAISMMGKIDTLTFEDFSLDEDGNWILNSAQKLTEYYDIQFQSVRDKLEAERDRVLGELKLTNIDQETIIGSMPGRKQQAEEQIFSQLTEEQKGLITQYSNVAADGKTLKADNWRKYYEQAKLRIDELTNGELELLDAEQAYIENLTNRQIAARERQKADRKALLNQMFKLQEGETLDNADTYAKYNTAYQAMSTVSETGIISQDDLQALLDIGLVSEAEYTNLGDEARLTFSAIARLMADGTSEISKNLIEKVSEAAENALSTLNGQLAEGEMLDEDDFAEAFGDWWETFNDDFRQAFIDYYNEEKGFSQDNFRNILKISFGLTDEIINKLFAERADSRIEGIRSNFELVAKHYSGQTLTNAEITHLQQASVDIDSSFSAIVSGVTTGLESFAEELDAIANAGLGESVLNKAFGAEFDFTDTLTAESLRGGLERGTANEIANVLVTLGWSEEAIAQSFEELADGSLKFVGSINEALVGLSFADQAAAAQLSKKLQYTNEWFYETQFDNLSSSLEDISTTDLISAQQIADFWKEATGEAWDVAKAQEEAEKLNEILDPVERMEELVARISAAGVQIDETRLQELYNSIIDALIEGISSGASNLASGIEGTLSRTDWAAAQRKYNLGGTARQTARGVQLDRQAQLEWAAALYKDSEDQDFNYRQSVVDIIWEEVRGTESVFESWQSIEEELADVNQQIADGVTGLEAQRDLLEQMRHSAILNPDDPIFNFMEQDATDGLTQNFDNFVNQIDKVKSAFASFQSGESIGYQDFYNMMDFIRESESGWAKFSEMTGMAASDYEAFVNSVVANTDKWGQVDIGGVAAEMGISVDAAMGAMSEGMTEGLKDVAKQQIKYLSGVEAMLEALLAFESIGQIEAGIDFSFTTSGGDNFDVSSLENLWDTYNAIPDKDKKRFVIEFDTYIKESGTDSQKNLWSVLTGGSIGDGSDPSALFGMDYMVELQNFLLDAGQLDTFNKNIQSMTRAEAMAIAESLSNIEGLYDEEGKLIEGWQQIMRNRYDEMARTVLQGNWRSVYGESFADILSEGFAGANEISGFLTSDLGEAITGSEFKINLDSIQGNTVTFTGGKELIDNESAQEALRQYLNNKYKNQGIEVASDGIEVDATTEEVKVKFQKIPFNYNDFDEKLQKGLEEDFLGKSKDGYEVKLGDSIITLTLGENNIQFQAPDNIDSAGAEEMATKLAAALGGSLGEFNLGEGNIVTMTIEPKVGEFDTSGTDTLVTQIETAITNALSKDIPIQVDITEAQATIGTLTEDLDTLTTTERVVTPEVDAAQATTDLNDLKDLAIEVEETDPNIAVDVTDNATSVLQSIKAALDAIVSKTVVVTTIHREVQQGTTYNSFANRTPSARTTSDAVNYTGNVSGLALAGGNVETLLAGARMANKTLVGELGPELAVYDGKYHLLGAQGAEFVDLPDDAIVFNHLQTAGIVSGQMKGVRGSSAMATGNVTGMAFAGGSGIAGALAAVRRAKSVWQGLLNSLSAADLLGGGSGGGGGGGGDDNSLKAHIEDLQEWYNLSRQIAQIESEINTLLAKRKNITDGHEYLRNLRETQKLLQDQVNTQQDLLRYQQQQLKLQAGHINTNSIWSQFLEVDENGLLQYKEGNETNGGKGALSVLQQLNAMSGEEQLAYLKKLGWSYTTTDGEELEDEELVAKFFEELQKQIDDYDALADTVNEAEAALEDLESEINEIEREIRDNEIDLSQEIYDIIVQAWEKNIELLREQNELIKEANEAYANGIQEAIDFERQQYEQNQAIADREQLQRQLSLLRRSGGSASEIADLESQLDDMLKDEYFSNQEDALETIRDANERQVELLDRQVQLQEEALEYEKENGVIWTKAYEVMQGTDAEIISFMQGNATDFFTQSYLQQEDMLIEWSKKVGIYNEEKIFQYQQGQGERTFDQAWTTETGKGLQQYFNKASAEQQQKWKDEYTSQYATAIMNGATEAEAIAQAQKELYEHIETYKKALEDAAKQQQQQQSSDGGSSSSSSSSSSTSNKKTTTYYTYTNIDGTTGRATSEAKAKEAIATYARKTTGTSSSMVGYAVLQAQSSIKKKSYSAGGLVDYTGTAIVHGSKTKPESFINAEYTAQIREAMELSNPKTSLSEKLRNNFAAMFESMVSHISTINNNSDNQAITIAPGAITINVDQLADQYDLDDIYNDITNKLYSIGARASSRGVTRR